MEKPKQGPVKVNRPSQRDKSSSKMGKLINKTKGSVRNVLMALSLTTMGPSIIACQLEPPNMCVDTDMNSRTLDRFFDEYDLRKVDPIPAAERGKSLETATVKPDEMINMFGRRFSEISGLQINFANIFDGMSELDNKGSSFIYFTFKKDMAPLLDDLRLIDPDAQINIDGKKGINFTVKGKTYGISYEIYGFMVKADGLEYKWMTFDRGTGGYLTEIYDDEAKHLRYANAYDLSGNGVYRTYTGTSKPIDGKFEPGKLIEWSYKLNGSIEKTNIESLDDVKKLINGLDNDNLLPEITMQMDKFNDVIKKNPDGFKSLVRTLPSNKPHWVISVVFSMIESDEICETVKFENPHQIMNRDMFSNKNSAMLNATWSHLNGFKTTVNDVRITPEPGVEGSPAILYPVFAEEQKSGNRLFMLNGFSIQLKDGETMESIVENDNKRLAGKASVKLFDSVSF